MKAKIVELISGHTHDDKKRRVTLIFEDGAVCLNRITVPETALGYIPELDDVLELTITYVSKPGTHRQLR